MLNIFSLETTRTFSEFIKKIKNKKSLQLFRVSSLKSLEFQNQAIRMRYFFPKSTSISSISFPSSILLPITKYLHETIAILRLGKFLFQQPSKYLTRSFLKYYQVSMVWYFHHSIYDQSPSIHIILLSYWIKDKTTSTTKQSLYEFLEYYQM